MKMPPTPAQVKAGRGADGRYLPGASGCPQGRPVELPELRKMARSHTRECIDKLIEIIRGDYDGKTQCTAIGMLLDRGYGKPAQQVEIGGPGAFQKMTDDELKDFAQKTALKVIQGGKA